MSGLAGRERLQPSLLDRLTDNNRSARRDPPDQQALSLQQLRQAVLRDLAWLFNTTNLDSLEDLSTTPGIAASTVNYGVPGLAGMIDSSTRIGKLEERLTAAVRNFEPRIKPETVRVRARGATDDNGFRAFVFELEGELWAQPVPLQLFVETKIDIETRTAVLTETKARATR